MAEALALTASIIGVVQLADRIATVCKFYIESLEGCPRDLRLILVEISTLRTLFQSLEFIVKHDRDSSALLEAMIDPEGPIAGCLESVKELEKLIPCALLASPDHHKKKRQKREMVSASLAALAWPFKKDKACSLLNDIRQYKTTISMLLTTDSLQEIKDIRRNLRSVCERLTDAERFEICKWLQHTDPSSYHVTICDLYETGTGDWVFRTPEWTEWTNIHCRCIWIHGIPGAGKTVLASHLIEKVRQFETTDRDEEMQVATVYYYCYHARNQNDAAPFLRWIITQLCRKSKKVPTRASLLFRDGNQPNLTELLACLEEALTCFKTVFITIDAVDESQSRENLLNLIRDLVTDDRFEKVQLLVTSREYTDIKLTMATISRPISMSNNYVDADIRIYVTAKIQSTPRFRTWPATLSQEVRDALSEGAKGMFRWAVCQLDILRRSRDIPSIRRALKDLPQTLDETYIRIFSCIPENDWAFLFHTFRMIYSHGEIWRSSLRLSPHIVISSFPSFSMGDAGSASSHLYNVDLMKEICGCLITFSIDTVEDYEVIMLAHYTVREFLESSRVLYSPAAYFHIDASLVKKQFLMAITQHSLGVPSYELVDDRAEIKTAGGYPRIGGLNLDEYCLISIPNILSIWEEFVAEDESLMEVVLQVLDLSNPTSSTRQYALRYFSESIALAEICPFGERQMFNFFWNIDWIQIPDDLVVAAISLLLFSGYMVLAEQLATTIQTSRLALTNLVLSVEGYDSIQLNDSSIRFRYEGTILNFVAQASRILVGGAEALQTMISIMGPIYLDPTSTLISYIGAHNHEEHCEVSCMVEDLLRLGADPDPEGYPITPLQIAAFQSDKHGVEHLLQSGAKHSSIGNEDGLQWGELTLLGQLFNRIQGYSPLFLLRNSQSFVDEGSALELHEVSEVEDILLAHGAKELLRETASSGIESDST